MQDTPSPPRLAVASVFWVKRLGFLSSGELMRGAGSWGRNHLVTIPPSGGRAPPLSYTVCLRCRGAAAAQQRSPRPSVPTQRTSSISLGSRGRLLGVALAGTCPWGPHSPEAGSSSGHLPRAGRAAASRSHCPLGRDACHFRGSWPGPPRQGHRGPSWRLASTLAWFIVSFK